MHLDSGDAIVLEPRMTGLVLVADPPDPRAFAVSLHVSPATAARELLYWDRRGLGSVRLFSPKEFETAFGPDKLGPDALAMTADLFRTQLGDQPAGRQGGAARSAGRGRHRQLVRLGDSCTWPASIRPAVATE